MNDARLKTITGNWNDTAVYRTPIACMSAINYSVNLSGKKEVDIRRIRKEKRKARRLAKAAAALRISSEDVDQGEEASEVRYVVEDTEETVGEEIIGEETVGEEIVGEEFAVEEIVGEEAAVEEIVGEVGEDEVSGESEDEESGESEDDGGETTDVDDEQNDETEDNCDVAFLRNLYDNMERNSRLAAQSVAAASMPSTSRASTSGASAMGRKMYALKDVFKATGKATVVEMGKLILIDRR